MQVFRISLHYFRIMAYICSVSYILAFMKFLCFSLLLGLSCLCSWAAVGERHLEFFNDEKIPVPSDQIWAIEVDSENRAFFATNGGLYGFNGICWDLYHQSGNSALRALRYDSSLSRLYSAGVNEFGYWMYDDFGHLVYTLVYKNRDFFSNSEEYWRIAVDDTTGNVFFQCRERICVYDPVTGEISTVLPESFFQYLYDVDGKVYAQDGGTLVRFDGTRMSAVCRIDGRVINLVTSGGGWDGLIAAVEHKGLMSIAPDGTVMELNTAANSFLSAAKIACCERYDESHIIIGTTRYGMLLLDNDGNIDHSIRYGHELDNSTVLSVASDMHKDIWVGLDYGVAKIDNSTGDWYIRDGNLGKVHGLLELDGGDILVGSNKGLSIVHHSGEDPVEFLPGSAGCVWGLEKIDGKVYILHDQGLFTMDKSGKMNIVFDGMGVYSMKRFRKDTTRFLLGTYSGFVLAEKSGGKMSYICNVSEFKGFTRWFDIDDEDRVWVTVPGTGFVRLTASHDKRHFIDTRNFNFTEAGMSGCNFFSMEMDGKLVLCCGQKAYNPSRAQDTLLCNPEASSILALCDSGVRNVVQHGNTFWYSGDRMSGCISRNDGVYTGHSGVFEYLPASEISSGFIFFDDVCYVGFRNGIAYSYGYCNHSHRLGIESVSAENYGNTVFYDRRDPVFDVPGNLNMLKIKLYGLSVDKLVEYRVNTVSDTWHTEVLTDYLNISSLPYGSHQIEIRIPGAGETVTLAVRVHRPWYFSMPMLFLYILSAVFLCYCVMQYYTRRVRKIHARQLRQERIRRDREMARLERENLMKEKKISEMEKERLRSDLTEKNKRLANITMENIRRNNMLNSLKREVRELGQADTPQKLKSKSDRIIRQIDANMNDDSNWVVSENYFNCIYDGLLDRLKDRYPSLSKTDLRICVYIKLNLSTKEIADLMNISPKSVEMARYRLRKKLGLGPGDDISSVLR